MLEGELGPALVVVVDVDEEARERATRILGGGGMDVAPAESGKECLAVLERSLPDVLVIGQTLSDGPGLELLKQVKARHPAVQVIFISSPGSGGIARAATAAGAYDCLTGPFEENRLLTAAHNAVSYKSLSHRVVALEREGRGQGYRGIVGQSAEMKRLFRQLDRVAASDITVLIHGASGTGKELIARAIHENSRRIDGPFVALNCAAVPEFLQESELFGHEKGAFTGADSRRLGIFERAAGGTLFLDEVGELSPTLQAKLLRFLQERTFSRVGGSETIESDVRVLAATHRDLAEDVKEGRFREDLYFRIAVLELEVAPLRERDGDVALLAQLFLDEMEGEAASEGRSFSFEALDVMVRYPWPGNVRELQNVVQRAVVLAEAEEISVRDLPERLRKNAPPRSPRPPQGGGGEETRVEPEVPRAEPSPSPGEPTAFIPPGLTLAELERQAIEQAFARTGGNISALSRELAVSRATLYRKLKKYGILPG